MRSKALALVALLALVAGIGAACGGSSDSGSGSSAATGAASGGAGGGDYLQGGFPAKETPVKGGTLRMSMTSNIDCWNGLSYYGLSWTVYLFAARGLYGYPNTIEEPATDTMQPDLAADMPTLSEDGKTYTVKLREGLTFPDGSPVTAKDVKATYEYMLDPNIQCATGGPPSSGYYDGIAGIDAYYKTMTDSKGKKNPGISGIKVVDDLTVSFTLNEPDGSFPRALAMGWGFIRPASTPHKNLEMPPPFVGPYRISEYTPDKRLVIEREPSWENNVKAGLANPEDENNLDRIEIEIGVPEDIQLAKIKNNEIDIPFDGGAPIGSDIPAVANDPAYKDRFFSTPDASLDYGVFRVNKAPFDKVEARQAVNYAIDRDALIKITGGKLSRSPWSQILSGNLLGAQPRDIYTYDPEKAKQLIAAAGVEGAEVTLVHFAEGTAPEVAAAVKEQLAAVGLNVKLKALSADVFYGYLADPKSEYDLAIAGWTQDYSDAITYFGPLLTCGVGGNYGLWCDEAFDARVKEINALPPGEERANQFAQLATDTATNSAPWWTVDEPRKVSFISDRVGNYMWGPAKQFYFANYFVKDGK